MITSAIAHFFEKKKSGSLAYAIQDQSFIGLAIMVQGVCEQLHHVLQIWYA